MTKLLDQAIEHLKSLDAEKQDAIATLIMEELKDEAKWEAAFASSHSLLIDAKVLTVAQLHV